MFLDYLLRLHLDECCDILTQEDPLRFYTIRIDFLKLFELYPDVGDSVLCSPVTTLAACDHSIITAQQQIRTDPKYQELLGGQQLSVKKNVHARFFGLPVCPELHRTAVPKNIDVGCFIKVTGTVVRVTQAKMLEHQRVYVCVKCKQEKTVEANYEERYILKPPTRCDNQIIKCKSGTFTQVNLVSREHCKDYQEIKIQEQVNKLSIGSIPGSMWITVEDDLVDCCKPGDDIQVCGVVRRRWRPLTVGRKCEVELVLYANHVEVCNTQRTRAVATAPDVEDCFQSYWDKFKSCPMKGRDNILDTVCPQVYGLHLVKLALLLTVMTGCSHQSEEGEEDQHRSSVRGQCHLLLVGDPGTGKSQLLRAGAELTPRAVFTSGTGSTRAGLTCAALKEDGEWQLEAGALVLADGGVCCIDEIGQLREHDRAGIHEAMEQQTISIAKAGIVCKLNTRCAVIGACNPKGHYQPDEPLSANVSLGTALLSRFDLVFILLDTKNEDWDKLVSSYILFGNESRFNPAAGGQAWSIEKLQMYIGRVSAHEARMSASARDVLQAYYMQQRRATQRDQARTTVRSLDSLVRLSQAHSRLMNRDKVLTMDAVVAVQLIDLSMQDATLTHTSDALHSTKPQYPDYHYLLTAKQLLTRINLNQIWNEELLYYSKLLNVDHITLKNDIDKESFRLFTKFDGIIDDNIPLSCSIVTSSYFKNNEETVERANENAEKSEVNVELTETKTKHLSKSKMLKRPVQKIRNIKGSRKRKVREMDVNIKAVNEKYKTINAKSVNIRKKRKTTDSRSSDENCDPINLNHVPSVNDVFANLGLNLNLDTSCLKGETS